MKACVVLFALTRWLALWTASASSVAYNGTDEMEPIAGPIRMLDPEAIVKVFDVSSSDNKSPWVTEDWGVKTWKFNISAIGCQSARVHLSSFHLQGKDRLVVYGQTHNKAVGEETFKGLGDKDGNVYSHRVWADELVLQLFASSARSGFVIRYVQFGDCVTSDNPVGSVCGSTDWVNAICYETEYPEQYRLASGVVKLRYVSSSDGKAYVCTGFKQSDNGRFLTNYHCLGDQAEVSSAEVLDHYDSTSCSSDTGSERSTLHGETLLWTSGSTSKDASIFTVEESKADQIPCLPLASSNPSVGDRIDIIEHPSGKRKKIAIKSDQDAGGNCVIESSCRTNDWCYKCDTAGGSSGSPVFDYDSGNVVALHHYGGCPNSGVKISNVVSAAGNNLGSCSTVPVVDASFCWGHNDKTYFFRGSVYWRWNDGCDCADSGYPKSITQYWPGLPADLDAAVVWGRNGKSYFFKGSQYWRYNDGNDRVDSGYPRSISSGWKDLPDNLDAALLHTNGKTYFFKGDQYWRWNDSADKPDSGYPKKITSSTWAGIPTNVEAAVKWSNNRSYFFKQKQYYRYGTRSGNYPRATCWGWDGLPCY